MCFAIDATLDDQTERKRLLHLIHDAFDNVPFVGPDSLSLYQAEAWDSHEFCDQSRDHKGTWQTIPTSHFLACQWALAHLDCRGLHYYLPALMSHMLAGLDEEAEDAYIFESVLFTLVIDRDDRVLYDYGKERFSLFTLEQKHAVWQFLILLDAHSESMQAWAALARGEPWPAFE